jgi:integrase
MRTLGDAMDAYLVSSRFRQLAERTQREYERAIVRLRHAFGHLPPDAWRPSAGYEYLEAQRGSVQANRDLSVLSNVVQVCVRAGLVDRNLVKEVEKNREQVRERYVTDDEVAAFLDHCNPKLKAWIGLKLLTGLRQGQMRELRVSDWRDGALWGPKTKGGRIVVYSGPGLADVIAEVLRTHHGDVPRSTYLFCTRAGRKYTADGFRSIWHRAMAKHVAKGWPRFTEHDLRAKVASDSETLHLAQARLGHQDPNTTSRVYRRGPQMVTVLSKKPRAE